MELIQKKIPCLECPSYVKDFMTKWSGFDFQDMTLEQISKTRPKTFVVDENYILENMENTFKTMEKNDIKEMVIHAFHIYKFNNHILEKLDKLSAGNKVHFISMSYKVKTFRNIKAHSYDSVEHGISHAFNYILAERLRSRRVPSHDFLLTVNTKNEFRRRLCQRLEQSGVLKNSVVSTAGRENFYEILEKHQAIFDSIEQQLPGNMCLDALRFWGSVPNFSAYEKIFCEIVVESTNTGLDTTHDSPFSDLSEKTYKPIALGIPFVFLGSAEMRNKLIDDGYRLVDDGEFYAKWHSAVDLQTAVSHLVEFLSKITVDKYLRKNLESMAAHNYKNFWVDRKLAHQSNNLKILKECFGESPYDRIYDCFDF